MALNTWKRSCFALPPFKLAMRCATPPKIRSQASNRANATTAVAGSMMANRPNTMNSTAAKMFQPVNLLATSITGRSVAM